MDTDAADTPRVVYRLPRACQRCHWGQHAQCEVWHYASPFEPQVECECEVCAYERMMSGLPRRSFRVNPAVITIDNPRHPNAQTVHQKMSATASEREFAKRLAQRALEDIA